MLRGIRQRTIASYIILFCIFILLFFLNHFYVINVFTVLLGCFWATFFICWFTTRRLIEPLEQITSVAQEMAGGILDTEIRVAGDEEIDELAWSINYMARELRKNLFTITEERNRARAILNSMADGVIALDKNGTIILINPAVEKLLKVKETETLGRELIKVVRNYELDELFNRALQSRQAVLSNELQMLTPEPRLFRVHVTPINGSNGEKMGVVGLLRDVTQRRKLEKMRTEFVANVSHELRTPLTSINGFMETLLDGAIDDPVIARRFLEIMNTESNRLSRLVDDLLQLSKLEYRKGNLNKQPVNLTEVIRDTVEVFKNRAAEKNLSFTSDIPELPEVPGDQGLLVQVMVNLVDNAIKYTPEGNSVTVGASFDGQQIRVFVKDTGIGIPEESLSRVFERFYRVDKARSRDVGGTGLGLSISKHIVEAHGGKIWAESHSEGSTFIFTLPLGQ
ncbi:two-component system histidine kinase PnpS [Desulforamulus ruminis]|uniref:histidine kinase n=1 Tax=Desulforamulus ruminis (strain ATCC 23193 / DSM 2154 / NCIMB 8452 / DL) TaxID=696281 RepID=F6DKA0_DESRL|nr:ATP-binding protein [Desulforamulus ruminis]AEG61517.1 PAS sensor protein [Desulforamulus ruminis DSM 2154]